MRVKWSPTVLLIEGRSPHPPYAKNYCPQELNPSCQPTGQFLGLFTDAADLLALPKPHKLLTRTTVFLPQVCTSLAFPSLVPSTRKVFPIFSDPGTPFQLYHLETYLHPSQWPLYGRVPGMPCPCPEGSNSQHLSSSALLRNLQRVQPSILSLEDQVWWPVERRRGPLLLSKEKWRGSRKPLQKKLPVHRVS